MLGSFGVRDQRAIYGLIHVSEYLTFTEHPISLSLGTFMRVKR
ncbi:hypothetical protein [Bacillus atrophaeus]|nr:hypothetical protein [Bacillus atrophaeus]MEC1902006.1 hypothetical protein [Bacillus atrophaeus]